ncbi:MFS transporter [Nocardia jiangxiensis]|uniref:MFS transporter n=1 Tax=Nocardia jiangxiensis TaxID=282685 RepID=UPI000309FA58|nr:MFS transporter [Nocardia jiangxiensis]
MSETLPTSPAITQIAAAGQRPRQVAIAGLLGTFIEFYDFTSYGFLVVYLAPLFFPARNPTTGILATLGVFGAGYLARPLGALFFGRLGDRRGRRFALLATIIGMGTATTVLGVLPTYATIGVTAPIALTLVRMVQGFCAGGEISGASTFVAESDGGRNRGRLQALIPLGSSLGVAIAPAVVGLAVVLVGTHTMGTWGWRLPLLLSAVMTLLVVIYRVRIDDSTEFRSIAEAETIERSPVRVAILGHWRMILATAALNLVGTMILGVLVNYMSVYLITVLHLPAKTVYWLSAICLLLGSSTFLAGGWLTDRFGRRATAFVGWALCAALIFPVLYGMAAIGSGGVWALLGVGVLYVLALTFSYLPMPAIFVTMSQSFPTQVRFTCTSLGYNIGAVLGGGVTPYLAAQLSDSFGTRAAGWLAVAAAIVGILVMARLTTKSGKAQQV